MTTEDLVKILYALEIAFPKEDAKKLFIKMVKNLKIVKDEQCEN